MKKNPTDKELKKNKERFLNLLFVDNSNLPSEEEMKKTFYDCLSCGNSDRLHKTLDTDEKRNVEDWQAEYRKSTEAFFDAVAKSCSAISARNVFKKAAVMVMALNGFRRLQLSFTEIKGYERQISLLTEMIGMQNLNAKTQEELRTMLKLAKADRDKLKAEKANVWGIRDAIQQTVREEAKETRKTVRKTGEKTTNSVKRARGETTAKQRAGIFGADIRTIQRWDADPEKAPHGYRPDLPMEALHSIALKWRDGARHLEKNVSYYTMENTIADPGPGPDELADNPEQ